MSVKRGIFAKRHPARQHNIEAKLRVGFLLTPRFTLTAFAGFIDALRLAADEGDRSRPQRCRWDVLGTEGTPILSSCGTGVLPTAPYGSPEAYVSAELQEQVYRNLVDIERCAVIVRVAGGVIEDIRCTSNESRFAVQLNGLIESDDNYRKIHEIGFGLNPNDGFFLDENFLPNEMQLGVHFGLGLTPYTKFHLDIACSAVSAISDMGNEQVKVL